MAGAAKSRIGLPVAVIGAGPAGLSAAHDLALLGYYPTIFEAAPYPGGMALLGVPEYRLPRDLLKLEIEDILDRGGELKLTCDWGGISVSETCGSRVSKRSSLPLAPTRTGRWTLRGCNSTASSRP